MSSGVHEPLGTKGVWLCKGRWACPQNANRGATALAAHVGQCDVVPRIDQSTFASCKKLTNNTGPCEFLDARRVKERIYLLFELLELTGLVSATAVVRIYRGSLYPGRPFEFRASNPAQMGVAKRQP